MGAESGRGIGASKYYINDNSTNIKTIKKLVQNVYHVQLNNLCTFLPQDKVGSFSDDFLLTCSEISRIHAMILMKNRFSSTQ
jgi:hypothetical protein